MRQNLNTFLRKEGSFCGGKRTVIVTCIDFIEMMLNQMIHYTSESIDQGL